LDLEEYEMERLRWIAAVVVFAGGIFGWSQPGAAQTKAPPDAKTQERLRELEETVQLLKQKLDEKEAVTAPSPKVDELDQKIRIIEREREIEKEDKEKKAKEAPLVTWKDGFNLKTPDDKFTLKLNGELLFDIGFIDQDDTLKYSVGDEQDGTAIRDARLRLSGAVYKNIEYQLEVQFAGENGQDTPSFLDTYVQLKGLPSLGGEKGQLRIGHFREPFSLEELTRTPSLTFLEKSLSNVFVPSRNLGVQWSEALLGEPNQERLTYAVGVFKTTDNWPSSNDSDEDRGYNITGRVTGLPWYEYNGEHLWHVGAAYSHANPDGAVLGFDARPETRLSLFKYAAADSIASLFRLRDARADDLDLYNLESALVLGPLSLQGEYTLADVKTTFDGDHSFDGYYLQASYFLTGEHRPYRNSTGTFDRVRPAKNFGLGAEDGWGAFEVAARYSNVNLTDGAIRGGQHDATTAGVNWYLNPNTRLSLDYIYNTVDNDLYDGDFDVLQLRVFLDF